MKAEDGVLRTYHGDALRSLAFPLGGIGTGHFCVRGDGGFGQWQICNQVNHTAYLPGTFLAVRAQRPWQEPVLRLLQTHQEGSLEPAPGVSDHLVRSGARELAGELPTVGSLRIDGRYPIARVHYEDPALPVGLTMEAFSPFIPLDEESSGLPVVFLVLNVRNPGKDAMAVSLLASMQNAVGWDGLSTISGLGNPGYGGNRNLLIRRRGSTFIVMENPTLEEGSPRKGEMVVGVLGDEASARVEWDDLKELWEDFRSDGRLGPGSLGPSRRGATHNAALAQTFSLKGGEEREVTFLIAWHFPNRYVNWDQSGLGIQDRKSLLWIGNAYARRFGGALEVAEYGFAEFQRLRSDTMLFRDSLYTTSIPWPVLDAAGSQMATIRSPTCMWTEDGMFHGFEGCRGSSTGSSCEMGGCCPLDCTHVWNYEQTLSKLFPGLERRMRDVDLSFQMGEDGRIPHRTVLPLYLPRWSSDERTSAVYAADGHCGTILKTYREFRQSGDTTFLNRHWNSLKKALAYAIEVWDPDQDGIFDGPQWNTYDCHLFGHNSFVSGLYLAALRAMEEMSRIQNEGELADRCRAIYQRGSRVIDGELWEGEYYRQVYDQNAHKGMQYGAGCHSDQLLGQWWAHVLDLGHILPEEHVRAALKAIRRYNLRKDMRGHEQKPRVYLRKEEGGLLICTWPRGGRPDPVTLYSDEVWTGIEYAVAGLMFYEGMVSEGVEIVEMARRRHDGRLRSPWNEVECGDHYVRPMSSWSMLEALAGFDYDGHERRMRFRPVVNEGGYRTFFIAGSGWGTYSQREKDDGRECALEVAYGALDLRELVVPSGSPGGSIELTVDGRKAGGLTATSKDGWLVIQGDLHLERGQTLRISSS